MIDNVFEISYVGFIIKLVYVEENTQNSLLYDLRRVPQYSWSSVPLLLTWIKKYPLQQKKKSEN